MIADMFEKMMTDGVDEIKALVDVLVKEKGVSVDEAISIIAYEMINKNN